MGAANCTAHPDSPTSVCSSTKIAKGDLISRCSVRVSKDSALALKLNAWERQHTPEEGPDSPSWLSEKSYQSVRSEDSPVPARKRRASRLCHTYRFDADEASALQVDEWGDCTKEERRTKQMLQTACRSGNFQDVVDAISKRADVNCKTLNGVTPIMMAAASGTAETKMALQFLMDALADLEARDDNGWTALHHAARNGRKISVEFLLENGSSVAATTGCGKTSATLAALEGSNELVMLLLDKKAKIDKKDETGWPVLFYACEGKLDLVKYIVKAQANLKATSKDKMTAFLIACKCGNFQAVKFLFGKGASMHSTNSSGDNALMIVVKSDSPRKDTLCNYLMEEGIDTLATNANGESASQLAKEYGLLAVRNAIDKMKVKMMQEAERQDFERKRQELDALQDAEEAKIRAAMKK